MTDYGGLGGIAGGREIDEDNPFEISVFNAMGERIRESDDVAREMWSALSNVDWYCSNGDTFSCSFRHAGDLVAAITGKGDYLDWYCCGPVGFVSERIKKAMEKEGWYND